MKESLPTTSASELAKIFYVQLVLNSLVILVASALMPTSVVLGNANSNMWWALFHSMIMLSLVGSLAVPKFEMWQKMKGIKLTMKDWMIGYLLVNFVALWIITRFSEQFGLGISHWSIVLILAAILDTVQGMGMQLVYPKKK